MKRFSKAPLLGVSIIALCSLLAACGGGGGGGSTTPPVTNPGGGTGGGGGNGGGGNPSASPSASPSSAPTQTPSATGSMTVNGSAVSLVAFTCGCTGNAGSVNAGASGTYTITVPATGLPAGSGQYSPLGHNLMVIGYVSAPSHGQAWSMEFFGSTPSHDMNLSGNANANVSDEFTAAAALYVYYETIQYYAAHPPANANDNTYDVWNFNQIASFAQGLRASGGNNAAEQKLILDIKQAQSTGASLYPAVPQWDKTSSDASNGTIVSDIKAVATSGDAAIPTPCGTSCSGTPSP